MNAARRKAIAAINYRIQAAQSALYELRNDELRGGDAASLCRIEKAIDHAQKCIDELDEFTP